MKHRDIVEQMTLEEKCYFLSGKDFWQTRSLKRLGIESIKLSDGPHGVRTQMGAGARMDLGVSMPATCFPTAATMANAWDPALSEAMGRLLGEEAACQDVSVLLGPGLNLKRSPLCGRNFEYFSEDPYLSGKLAAAMIRGIQSTGIAACAKHFAANGTELRRMASDSVMDERTLRELYLTGFEIAVKEGKPRSIMSAYNLVNGVYASENAHLLTEILRDDWGFDGFVVTDWGACNDFTEAVRAGVGLEMPGTGGDSPEQLLRAVNAGTLAPEIVDMRVDELLDVALDARVATDGYRGRVFDVEAHHAFARRCAEEAIVLLKNEGGILPLKPGSTVVVLGDFARRARFQGAGSSEVNCTRLENPLDVIDAFDLDVIGYLPGHPRHGAPDPAMIEGAVKLAKGAEYVLMYLGLDEVSESEALDRPDMKLPDCQARLLEAVSAVNPNIIVVLSGGAPVEMPWLDRCRALVHGYLGGQAGAGAMLRVLTGQVNPSGRLAESYPLKYEDCPSAGYYPAQRRTVEYREGLYVGYRYFNTAGIPVRFPFGYGLSYTSFAYSDIQLKGKRVTFTLTNTGDRDGAEVAQLYVHAENPSVYRPDRELKGFAKVYLKAGERRRVSIPLDDRAFRYWNSATNRFERDGGVYQLQVGASVEDIRLTVRCRIRGSGAPACEDRERLAPYYAADIRNVPDAAFEALLGHPIPDGNWSDDIRLNDALSRLQCARSLKARLVWRLMTALQRRSLKRGVPDIGVNFACNMTLRALGKLAGGYVSQEMCRGMLDIVNGHAIGGFRGMGRVIAGYHRQRKVRKKSRKLE